MGIRSLIRRYTTTASAAPSLRAVEQVPVAGLQPQVVLDGHLAADRARGHHLAGLGLEDGEQPGLGGEPGDPNRVGGRTAPAGRAGHEDVQVAGAVEVHRAGGLVL
jgi:hypothetical protein